MRPYGGQISSRFVLCPRLFKMSRGIFLIQFKPGSYPGKRRRADKFTER